MSSTNIEPWLSVIGIGENGLEGLTEAAKLSIASSEIVIGGKRHLSLISNSNQIHLVWPSPLNKLVKKLDLYRGRKTCILATGDPMCYGIGSTLIRTISIKEMIIIPSQSALALACARIGWKHEEVDLITLHGRPFASIDTHLRPHGKLIVLSNDENTPIDLAHHLVTRGYGDSHLTVLEHMAGPLEKRYSGCANNWKHPPGAALNTVAISLSSGRNTYVKTRAPGLDDGVFINDGQLTKREIRALTISALEPYPGALLWDIGAGSGAISIEWMRIDPRCHAIAIECNIQRATLITKNAENLGTPYLRVVNKKAPSSLSNLPRPNAIFIGGGITQKGLFEKCWQELREGGCLVCNLVTAESEAKVFKLQGRLGGSLTRLAVSRLEPLGKANIWRPHLQITQWKLSKPHTVRECSKK
ncbi:MAG: cobalamin biosynthesis bifunctional protein CbiET [Rhodospirillaceae bacterium]|nr:cobalamin biosynthesis bifunctional protein CbiET [Rhodospirillaceae bacterium]